VLTRTLSLTVPNGYAVKPDASLALDKFPVFTYMCVYINKYIIMHTCIHLWLSQYPHEAELLFLPLTGCEIIDLGKSNTKKWFKYIYI